MAYSIIVKEKARKLRALGHSINEIRRKTGVSKSIISGWTKDVRLNAAAKSRILSKIKAGQLKSSKRKLQETKGKLEYYRQEAILDLRQVSVNNATAKVICALMYWCEGGKDQFSGVHFTNSDPRLIKSFLYLFRRSFNIDESKLRVCVHLHDYHNIEKQIKFWSKVANIPATQFVKPFLKPHSGKRIKKDYNGCIDIRYHSNDTARQLLMTAEAFLLKYPGGIV